MGKDYKRRSARGSYGEDALKRALDALRDGQSFHRVAKDFEIPRRTLQRHFKGLVLKPGQQCLGRFRVTFAADYEQELVAHALDLQQRFFGMTPLDMRRLAFQLAEKQDIDHQFNRSKQMAGRKWLHDFISRHKELAMREPEATSLSRAVAFNKPQVNRFFDLLKAEYEKAGGVTADQIYNMDESGLTAVHKPGRILAKKGQKQVGKVTSGERGKTVTIICTVNAMGSFIPPLMIFPRKNMSLLLIKDGPPGTIGAASMSGWTDCEIFLQWLKHFVAHVKPTRDKPAILLLDGHASHKSLNAIEFCRSNHVTLLSFPPHTTHKLQPLDVSFFGPLKTFYNSACDCWMAMNPGKRIGFYDIASLFKTAYLRAATMEKGINGFAATGIFPLNGNKFVDEDFAPCLLTEESQPMERRPSTSSTAIPTNPAAATDPAVPRDLPAATTDPASTIIPVVATDPVVPTDPTTAATDLAAATGQAATADLATTTDPAVFSDPATAASDPVATADLAVATDPDAPTDKAVPPNPESTDLLHLGTTN